MTTFRGSQHSLAELLQESFTTSQLRAFLRELDPKVEGQLPEACTPDQLFADTVAVLKRKGLICERFFVQLQAFSPPQQRERIAAVAKTWGFDNLPRPGRSRRIAAAGFACGATIGASNIWLGVLPAIIIGACIVLGLYIHAIVTTKPSTASLPARWFLGLGIQPYIITFGAGLTCTVIWPRPVTDADPALPAVELNRPDARLPAGGPPRAGNLTLSHKTGREHAAREDHEGNPAGSRSGPTCTYSVTTDEQTYEAPYRCAGGVVMPASASIDPNTGMLTVSSSGKAGGYGAGTYHVLVFDPGGTSDNQCKSYNITKATKVLNKQADSITFPAFDTLLTCGKPTDAKGYCIAKEDAGDATFWCSGMIVATYD